MKTNHTLFFQNSSHLDGISSDSVDLIVTSPPYPMIEMWDKIFIEQDKAIGKAIQKQEGNTAFELMHRSLDSVWDEAFRVLKTGGFACINIGDATRSIKSNFAIYPNHARILHYLVKIGFTALPEIIWRKQTNAPNKFMGSGMLPAGAYVTLEHEYILIVRKGPKREFSSVEKQARRESAIFWEERNIFFSDIWFDIKGTRQGLLDKTTRKRSAAFPFEVAYRLINMYSMKGDTVLDPFLGTGTTTAASMAAARNSIGCEIDKSLYETIIQIKDEMVDLSNSLMEQRLRRHIHFINDRIQTGNPIKHKNIPYGFPVITSQEKELIFNELKAIKMMEDCSLQVDYSDLAQASFCLEWGKPGMEEKSAGIVTVEIPKPEKKIKDKQLEMF